MPQFGSLSVVADPLDAVCIVPDHAVVPYDVGLYQANPTLFVELILALLRSIIRIDAGVKILAASAEIAGQNQGLKVWQDVPRVA